MKEELLFCPLGGSGEIGMNMNLFAYGKPDSQKWIMVDIGNNLKIVDLNGTVDLKPFKIEFITLTHSILEPNGLKFETPVGSLLHTGDWKCDPNPLIGDKIDSKRLQEIG